MNRIQWGAWALVALTTSTALVVAKPPPQAAKRVGAAVGAQAPGKAKGPSKSYRRVPKHWGQIGLSKAQKERIYEIQATYGARIEALEQQIQRLKQQQHSTRLALLTVQQRAQLEVKIKAAEQARKQRQQRKSNRRP